MNDCGMKPCIIASGARVILRDRLPDDVDRWIYWRSHGVWREYDAPWETLALSVSPDRLNEIRKTFLESCVDGLPIPRKSAIISTTELKPLGSVNRYEEKRFPSTWSVGIAICEDEYLDRGIGTEALALWIHYLLNNSDVHRLALATYSFNHRMLRVAEKVGFAHEGVDREIVRWKDRWFDRVRFGMLRCEWEQSLSG